jgi:2',3'-cyclic-nucleotide 2'-phosphodiesterase (5'-nucleotidase family)
MAKLKHFRCLKIKHFVVFITILVGSCKKQPALLTSITGKRITLDSTLPANDPIEKFISPYRNRINTVLDSALAYAPYSISNSDGPLNTTAGNLMADLILEMANPIFKKRTGNAIDFVLMNQGGIRAVISKGNVSARTAYEVMPFENYINVVSLTGESIQKLVAYIVNSKRPHPFSQLEIELNTNGSLSAFAINGNPIQKDKLYFVATSDYLVSGGDDMVFFKDAVEVYPLDYKIRNAMIDYFKKVDTLRPVIDGRYTKLP